MELSINEPHFFDHIDLITKYFCIFVKDSYKFNLSIYEFSQPSFSQALVKNVTDYIFTKPGISTDKVAIIALSTLLSL